jgi:hypothetical protein
MYLGRYRPIMEIQTEDWLKTIHRRFVTPCLFSSHLSTLPTPLHSPLLEIRHLFSGIFEHKRLPTPEYQHIEILEEGGREMLC